MVETRIDWVGFQLNNKKQIFIMLVSNNYFQKQSNVTVCKIVYSVTTIIR